jgi:uncharacterized protein with WD repeat
MPKAPAENRESPRDLEPRVREAAAATTEQSKERLTTMLESKLLRISTLQDSVETEREKAQFDVAKNSVDQRYKLLETITA